MLEKCLLHLIPPLYHHWPANRMNVMTKTSHINDRLFLLTPSTTGLLINCTVKWAAISLTSLQIFHIPEQYMFWIFLADWDRTIDWRTYGTTGTHRTERTYRNGNYPPIYLVIQCFFSKLISSMLIYKSDDIAVHK